MNTADYIQLAAVAFAAIAAVASWQSIFVAKQLKKDDELFAHAILALERSYSALMNGHEGDNHPRPDRLNWLTSARLIEDYLATKKEIKTAEILRRCEGHEEFWRNQFYQRLEPLSLNMSYYSVQQSENPIYPTSAIVVHGFASWPNDKPDVLDKYEDKNAAIAAWGLSPRWAGLRQYLGLL